jgi:hypothetical protein
MPPATVGPRLTRATLPFWAEGDPSHPSSAGVVPVDFTLWRVAGT